MTSVFPCSTSAAKAIVRHGWVMLLAVLGIAIVLVYQPSLKHVPHSDHQGFLLETTGHDDFFDLVRHTYSWTRTRLYAPGDTQLYRPLLFAWLSGLKACFGTHWDCCQAVGITLHALVCILLFILVREVLDIQGVAGAWAAWLPFTLAFFFALNGVIVEQVIWFHIQPYLVALALMLGAAILLLRCTRVETSSWMRTVGISAAWLMILAACFVYELGQFQAVMAAIFLVMMGATRRRLVIATAFLGIVVIYQAANHIDRQIHRATFHDDMPLLEIVDKAASMSTIENSLRYGLFTVVGPFTRGPIGFLHHGKLFIPEHLWYRGSLEPHFRGRIGPPRPEAMLQFEVADMPLFTIAAWLTFALGLALVVAGLLRLARTRDREAFARAFLVGGGAAAQAMLVVLGRMNFRPYVEPLALNSHHAYSALLWSLALGSMLVVPLVRGGVRARAILTLFSIGLVGIGIDSGCRVHRLNTDLAQAFREQRACWRSLTQFFDAHQHEPDFSYALAIPPGRLSPNYCEIPLPFVADLRHFDGERPKYVLWCDGPVFENMLATEWEECHPQAPPLFARLVQLGRHYQIFERDGRYFAVGLPGCVRPFLYSAAPAADPRFHSDSDLESLQAWVREQSR